MVFLGNFNVNVEIAIRTSHLFTPFPKEMQDLALLDRIHAYLPGWEVPKVHSRFITQHYGFVVDYLAEFLHSLREFPVGHLLDRYFRLGPSLNKRDEKAVRRTVSGLIKLLHPDGKPTKEEVEEYLQLALEMRRRVKEQLKRMGGIEFWNTHFTYVDAETGVEKGVKVPEQASVGLIPTETLPPGVVFTVAADPASGRTGIFRLEVACVRGGGGYALTGSSSKNVRDAIRTAYDYLQTHWGRLAVEKALGDYQLNIQVVDLRHTEGLVPSSVAVVVAIVSAMLERSVTAGTVVLGDMTLQGAILPVVGFADCLQTVAEEGGLRVILPIQNAGEISQLPGEIVRRLSFTFYTDPVDATLKALSV
ncbi:MAG: hypothetical protein DRN81_06725 [Thermoproteota archaeon]|nr:MAG: hypothetical protein DRN81_06725 [Candidatus Korarchaeota archaeon]